MKKIYTLFMVSAIAMTTRAQLVFNENFTGYTTGGLNGQGSWTSSGSGSDVQVANSSPLTYSGYNSGAEYITTSMGNNKSSVKTFSPDISTSTAQTMYMAFVINVSGAKNSNAGYSISLQDNSGTPVNALQFFVQDASSTTSQFGITDNGAVNPTYTSGTYAHGTTHLIVIRYDIVAGSNNDKVYMWVDPSVSTAPNTAAADVTLTGNESYGAGASFHALQVHEGTSSASASFDAFRVSANSNVAAAWALLNPAASTLPVTLTSFNANTDGLNNTKLVWNTSNESGIVSYVIEKSTDGRTFSDIGSVQATQQSTYSFTDNQASTDYTYYRLKMVEQDGSFKYSFIVSLKSKLSLNISLSPNPVRSTLLIQHPKVGTEAHIEIVNTSGQLIKDIRIPASAVLTSIDMSGLSTGLYHVVFKNGTDVFSKMVLKQQ